jgi:hypothetical protein
VVGSFLQLCMRDLAAYRSNLKASLMRRCKRPLSSVQSNPSPPSVSADRRVLCDVSTPLRYRYVEVGVEYTQRRAHFRCLGWWARQAPLRAMRSRNISSQRNILLQLDGIGRSGRCIYLRGAIFTVIVSLLPHHLLSSRTFSDL